MKPTTGKKPYRLLLVLLAGLVVLGAIYTVLTRRPAAPDVAFQTLDGRTVHLQQLRGQVVYVDFWATSCVGCVHDAPQMAQLYRQYHARGLTIVGVNAYYDPPAYAHRFVEQFQVPYPDSLDPQGRIAHAFGDIQVVPTSFLIDRQGRIAEQIMGDPDFPRLRARIEKELGNT